MRIMWRRLRRADLTVTVAVAALAAALVPSAGVAATCAPPAEPALSVVTNATAPTHDETLSMADLDRRAPTRPDLHGYSHALGLTEIAMQARTEMRIETAPGANGGFCSTLRSMTVTVTWTTVVHLAAELPPGSCIRRMVEKHEQGHVNLARALMPVAKRALEQAIAAVARNAAYAGTVAASQQALRQRADAAINRTVRAFSADSRRRQLGLDTPQEYAKVPQACGADAVNRLLQG